MSQKYAPKIYENLHKNEGINETNLPFSAQPHDAIHEQYNKKGAKIFKAEEVEDFDLAFTIVDDIYALRSKMFNNCDISDKMNENQAKIPNYEPLIMNIRKGLRKTKFYLTPENDNTLKSISGLALNPELLKIFTQ